MNSKLRPALLSGSLLLLLLALISSITILPVKAEPAYQAAPTATIPAKTVGYITAAPPVSLNTPSTIDSIQVKALVEGGPLVAPNTGLSSGIEGGIIGLVIAITGLLLSILCWYLWTRYQHNRSLRRARSIGVPVMAASIGQASYSTNSYPVVSQSPPITGYSPARPPSPAIDNVPPRQPKASGTPVPNQVISGTSTITCPNCNQTLRAGSKFCGYCATPIKIA